MRKTRFWILLAVCVALAASLFAHSASAAGSFTDVPDGAWYTADVIRANELGIMNGTSATTFAPLKNLTRAEYVAILFRLSNGEENIEFSFTDVPEGVWYEKYVGWAESTGIITGYGNAYTFGGNELITREQLMLMTSRYMDYKGIAFPDSADAVEFADKDKISSWAAKGVETTRLAGLVKGDKNSNFNPQNNATRAEIAAIVVRYTNALPTAVDHMYSKLSRILELTATTGGKNINLSFASGTDFIVNYYTDNSIRQQLFPQMGLSLDDYELVMDKDEVAAVREKFVSVASGGTLIDRMSFAIRNRNTLEVTETVTHTFFIKKVAAEYVTVDPDVYHGEFPVEIYEEMLGVSLKSTGNIARLAEFFAKAERGEKVSVGYLGGSITEGANALPGRSWSEVTQRWIEKHVSADAEYVNAGIGGSSSAFGNMRLEKHILDKGCDLVFVEFAVNDNQYNPFHQDSFEALLRRLLEDEDAPAVVIVLSACEKSDEDAFAPMEAVSAYYDLPVVDVRRAAHFIFGKTEMTYEDFASDGIHPYNFGHRMMADMVINLLDTVKTVSATATKDELTIKKPAADWYYSDRFEDITFVDAGDMLNEGSGWSVDPSAARYGFDKCISSSSSDNVLEFTFNGRGLLIANTNSDAYIEVSVDGGEYKKISCYDGAYAEAHEVFCGDSSGAHTVKIRVSPENSTSACTIVGFGIVK
ncbi:MAG: S-layer homology domain-containing protein [Clostridia bacterium]|nr:S-layer homology domain-containing protein [Clostridia bacterium]